MFNIHRGVLVFQYLNHHYGQGRSGPPFEPFLIVAYPTCSFNPGVVVIVSSRLFNERSFVKLQRNEVRIWTTMPFRSSISPLCNLEYRSVTFNVNRWTTGAGTFLLSNLASTLPCCTLQNLW